MPGLTPGDLIDIDMDAVDGEGVIHLSNADYLTRPLRLAADEALALVLALRTLREIAGPGRREAVDRALAKLEAAAGDLARSATGQRRGRGRPRRHPGHRSTTRLQRGKRLDLTYDSATRAETTRRHGRPAAGLRPRGLRLPRGLVLLWPSGLRTFRLDRIAAVEVTDDDVVAARRDR